ncbi:transcription antitermination factor NusB [Taylorella equigenitalis]|uniref:transcription antitermination factor NusB n=1 Tax=Taylorella equigenitalis TaxID=29575 RepID=UPI0004100422|nr:transcription antitermination factor NusB [Taylorella equigenitalis]ASY30115.1 N utilization substance protein B [Taylorella equigenitalis]KOS58703.1 antitermination protein NusB [Taylorella equigenitalis]
MGQKIGTSARHTARELVVQGLYSWLLSNESQDIASVDSHIREQENFDFADLNLYKTSLYGVIQNADSLREEFAPFISRSASELSPVEHAIMLLATYELLHIPETPYRVVINEAIELAKEFGGTDGFKFINGALDKLAEKIRVHE